MRLKTTWRTQRVRITNDTDRQFDHKKKGKQKLSKAPIEHNWGWGNRGEQSEDKRQSERQGTKAQRAVINTAVANWEQNEKIKLFSHTHTHTLCAPHPARTFIDYSQGVAEKTETSSIMSCLPNVLYMCSTASFFPYSPAVRAHLQNLPSVRVVCGNSGTVQTKWPTQSIVFECENDTNKRICSGSTGDNKKRSLGMY